MVVERIVPRLGAELVVNVNAAETLPYGRLRLPALQIVSRQLEQVSHVSIHYRLDRIKRRGVTRPTTEAVLLAGRLGLRCLDCIGLKVWISDDVIVEVIL